MHRRGSEKSEEVIPTFKIGGARDILVESKSHKGVPYVVEGLCKRVTARDARQIQARVWDQEVGNHVVDWWCRDLGGLSKRRTFVALFQGCWRVRWGGGGKRVDWRNNRMKELGGGLERGTPVAGSKFQRFRER
jgi:hypothetical protein